MDKQLAEMYGTLNDVDETDVEKLAAAKLAEELSETEETTIEDLSDEDAEALAQQLLGEETETVEEPEETEEVEQEASEEEGAAVEEPEKTSAVKEELSDEQQEKLAEADFLGRVMAHAYTQELKLIAQDEDMEKEARPSLKEVGGKVGKFLGKAKQKANESVPFKARKAFGNHKGKIGLGAGAAAGVAAGRASKKKESSALDTLVLARAAEILEANGLDPAALEDTEKKSSALNEDQEAVLNAKVTEKAVELLQSKGFEFAEEAEEEVSEKQETEE
jgi:hypothetical protein